MLKSRPIPDRSRNAAAVTTPVKGGECRRYTGCPANGPVEYCTFDGMVHGWAGAPQTGDLAVFAGGDQYESASELIWAFFAEQLN